MKDPNTCPRCGKPYYPPKDDPEYQGYCPNCIVQTDPEIRTIFE